MLSFFYNSSGGYMKIDYKRLIINILVPLGLGAIVGLLTTSKNSIDSIIPGWIFPIVWTILYILMGISSYLIQEETGNVSRIYVVQLIVNLLWSFIFFNFRAYTLAFIWILLLIGLVIIMIKEFLKVNKLAGYLQIPYVIWLFIALILNFMFIM